MFFAPPPPPPPVRKPRARKPRPAPAVNPSLGPTSRSLETWLELKHDPAWKYKPYRAPKSRAVPRPPRMEFTHDMLKYEYRVSYDRRTILEPVTLEVFLTLKHDPKYKPSRLPRATGLVPLSAKERARITAEVHKLYGARS